MRGETSSLSTAPLIQVGRRRQADWADRILARPVQKIKAGQLALMPALLYGNWSGAGWRAGLLFCPVLELLFPGCTNSSSSMVWTENQHSSYTPILNKRLVYKRQAKQKQLSDKVLLKQNHLPEIQVTKLKHNMWMLN